MSHPVKAVLAVVAVLMAGVALRAEGTPGKKPTGNWERKVGDSSVKINFKPDTVRFTVSSADATIDVDAEYSVTKDGLIYGVICKVEKKGTCGGPSEGDLFSFKCKIDKDTMTISDLKGSTESEEAKQLVQGDYKSIDK
jgi:hypothetical protein